MSDMSPLILQEFSKKDEFEYTPSNKHFIQNEIGRYKSTYKILSYLTSKHSNTCLLMMEDRMVIPNKIKNYLEQIQLTCNYNRSYDSFEFKIPDFSEYIIKMVSCTYNKTRFVIIPLLLKFNLSNEIILHQNLLIYDKIKGEIERFEPHGSFTYNLLVDDVFNTKLDQEILTFFNERKHLFGKIKKYYKPLDFCPDISLQRLEKNQESKDFDPSGFCSMWVIWYIDVRLNNQNKNRRQVIDLAIKKIQKMDIGFRNFIRNYAIFLYKNIYISSKPKSLSRSKSSERKPHAEKRRSPSRSKSSERKPHAEKRRSPSRSKSSERKPRAKKRRSPSRSK